MKNKFIVSVVFCALAHLVAGVTTIAAAGDAAAIAASGATGAIKLPYPKGERFVVVQGYDAPPTHIKKDYYAMDLSQNGCDAYGKFAVAASSGKVMLAQETGYNGGYGTQVLIDHGGNVVSRYAHLVPGSIPVSDGQWVAQGEPLGAIGDTGLVAGAACATHPGTHIHFAIYNEHADGSYTAHLPEPISGYTDIAAGTWYLSDNEIFEPQAAVSFGNAPVGNGEVLGAATSSNGNALQGGGGIAAIVPVGGVSAAPPSQASPPTQSAAAQDSGIAGDSASSTTTSTISTASSTPSLLVAIFATSSFNTTTLAIDLVWQPAQNASGSVAASTTYEIFRLGSGGGAGGAVTSTPIATTTSTAFSYPLSDSDFGTSPQFAIEATDDLGNLAGGLSTIQTIPVSLPDWFTNTVIQPIDNVNSNSSWYSDNWYDLGTGFYGMIRSLTLEGFINNANYFASHLWLDEYLDPGYARLNQTFTISDNAPFTNGIQKITIGGLDIPLQPNKYYRLRTYQDYQNRSVVLAGTSATGTAMWDEFIYSTGGVQHQYSFYPYLSAIMIPNYPPLMPPNPVASMAIAFDSLNSQINFLWPAATDPDTASSLLTYQVNIATSTVLSDAAWQSVGKNLSADLPVTFGNSYAIGVRAVDDLGNISQPLIEPWHFPAGYAPIPQQLDHAAGLPGGAQKITFLATTTVSGVGLWIGPQGGGYCCSQTFMSVHKDDGGIGDALGASNPVTIGQYAGDGEAMYRFSSPITLPAGAYWFEVDGGPSHTTNGTSIYGSSGDAYAGGQWSTAPGQDAYFRIEQATGP